MGGTEEARRAGNPPAAEPMRTITSVAAPRLERIGGLHSEEEGSHKRRREVADDDRPLVYVIDSHSYPAIIDSVRLRYG